MYNKMKKRKWHIKPRIIVMLSLLLIIIFVTVFLAFNLFINNYIKFHAESQLNALITMIESHDDKNSKDSHTKLPDVTNQPKNSIGVRGDLFVIDSNYKLVKHDVSDVKELSQIIEALETKNISLDNSEKVFIKTQLGKYYVSFIVDEKIGDEYYIFYVNVSDLRQLLSTINLALALILLLALIISFIVAGRIANSLISPINKISHFANEIGNGNFTQKEYDFSDIELSELAIEMNKTARRLENYDSEQRVFFQNVSHELRTPLMSIRCSAEGMEHGVLDVEKSSKIIISETDKLHEMIDDLLYLSRMDNIFSNYTKEEYDLRETLSSCAESLKSLFEEREIEIIYNFDNNPVVLLCNEKHIARACSNLLSNALRYAQNEITITCKNTPTHVIVSVLDDGKGISEEDLPHIFDRFYKGDDGKHGIGLSIVKAVMLLYDGEIVVDCDGGTKISLIFEIR